MNEFERQLGHLPKKDVKTKREEEEEIADSFLTPEERQEREDEKLLAKEIPQNLSLTEEHESGFESAEKRLEKIESLVEKIADISIEITPELYATNQEKFEKLAASIEKLMSDLEIALVSFNARVEIDYPRISFMQKVAVLLLGLVRGSIRESTVLKTFGKHSVKRGVLLKAAGDFREIASANREKISQVRQLVEIEKRKEVEREIEPLYMKILRENKEYQNLLKSLDMAVEEEKNYDAQEYYVAAKKASLKAETFKKQIKRIEEDAMVQARERSEEIAEGGK